MRTKPSGGADVKVRNAFGLPAGLSCPGETPFCDGCYAKNVERTFSSAKALVQRNYDALVAAAGTNGGDVGAMTDLLEALMQEYLREAERHAVPLAFRVHWDGDFYSVPYAEAWRNVILGHPEVAFWCYTRSFTPECDVVPALRGLPNLTLYLSVDRWNAEQAQLVLARDPWVLLAFCDDTQAGAAEGAQALRGHNVPACPENVKRSPLVVNMSGRRTDPVAKGDLAQGACTACRLCIDGVADVRFAIAKR